MAAVDQVLSVVAMRAAEGALIVAGGSVDALMQAAGHGAADYVWRIAMNHPVTVLCGPGNNGGDGYVIAEAIRELGGKVKVVAGAEPKSPAAIHARSLYRGEVLGPDVDLHGEVLVDCLFGSGLVRPLGDDHLALLCRLAAAHRHRIAIDLPSGVESDSGLALNPGLPVFGLTIALGAWKQAHFLMPAAVLMGELRLVDIGCAPDPAAAGVVRRPRIAAPPPGAHKYTRGLLGIVAGAMPGATVLAAKAAQGAGAGYVKLLAETAPAVPPDVVVDSRGLAEAIDDPRYAALLVGPGLGIGAAGQARMAAVLACAKPAVLDADALLMLEPTDFANAPSIVTPHAGEFAHLERNFRLSGVGSKLDRARALAEELGRVVVAKGPDTVIAAPDGRALFAPRASSWLSTAGTGDVLAGTIASRLAAGEEAFTAAAQGVWLHGEAGRLAGAAFTAAELAEHIPSALAACL